MARQWTCNDCGKQADHKFPALRGSTTFARDQFYCTNCMVHGGRNNLHTAFDRERNALVTKLRTDRRAEGEAFWAARGIAVGSAVTVFGHNLFGGRFPIHGIAKVGTGGAYVSSPSYPRRPLDASDAVVRTKT